MATNRSLRRLQLSFGAAWTAEWAVTVVLGVVAFRDGGPSAAGTVAFARMAPAAVVAPLGTALGDRFPREQVLRWSSLLRAAALGGAALALAVDAPSVVVYILAVVATVAFVVYRPAHSALLPLLCMTPLELTRAHVVRGLLDSISTFAGPMLAAVLLAVAEPAVTFGIAALLVGWSGWLMSDLSYEAPSRGRKTSAGRLVVETVEGYRSLFRYRSAGLLVALGSGIQTFTRGCLNVLLLLMAFELLGTGDAGVGVLTAAIGAGAVIGSVVLSMIVSGARLARYLGVGVALWGLPLALVGALPSEVLLVLVLMALIGVGNAFVDVGLFTLPARLVPDEILARFFGSMESFTALSVALGALVAPVVVDAAGTRWALVVIGLLGPIAVTVCWRRLRAIDASVVRRDREIEVLKQVPMLRPLPMPAIENLAVRVTKVAVPAGLPVFEEGSSGTHYYVIDDGEATVTRGGRPVRSLGPGDGFGEIALVRDVPRTATVTARTPLRLHALDRHDFVATVNGYASSARATDVVVTATLAADATADEQPAATDSDHPPPAPDGA